MSFPRRSIQEQNCQKSSLDFDGWSACSGCQELFHELEWTEHLRCCPKCGTHEKLSLRERIYLLADSGTFRELFQEVQPVDALSFVDVEPYVERLTVAQQKTGRDEAVAVGSCLLFGRKIALGVMDFSFMGGSMGSVVGERLTLLIEWALEQKLPLVLVSASGGARMQESTLSLMQMAKTSAALGKLDKARIPYISLLTNPTMGGVTASFATLGDIILAEPGALIGFAGPRVVEQTMRQKLPPNAQRAEFLLEKGFLDGIVPRRDLKNRIAQILDFLRN